MFFSSKQRQRRQQLLAEPFPHDWLKYLKRNVRQYALLPPAEKSALRDRLRVFIAEKDWVGCGGLTIDDEMKVAIAAQACLLVLGLPHEYYYDRIRTVLVYPGTYVHPSRQRGTFIPEQEAVYGEYWHRGPVIISWQNARGLEDHGNLVFHEFAHHLDDVDGEMDGMPPLESAEQERRWERIAGDEYANLARRSARGQATLLNQYGATSPAEFFAVSTECFFEQPLPLKEQHPALYEILRDFYQQDPAGWPWADGAQVAAKTVPDEVIPEDEEASVEETVRQMRLKKHGPDAYFARGVLYANAGDYERASAAYDEALRLAPDDGEIYQHRAEARLALGRASEAIVDADAAIRLDSSDLDARRTRTAAYLELGEHRRALEDAEALIRYGKPGAEDFRLRGLAKAGLRDLHGAISDLSRAVRRANEPAQAYLDRSRVYDNLGMPHEARADREKAYRLDPDLRDG